MQRLEPQGRRRVRAWGPGSNLEIRAGALALAAATLMGWGCTSTDEKLEAASLSQGCVINTDCAEPMVCAFRRCHNQCTSSRDCEDGARCVASDRPFLVCQLEDDRACTHNSDCPAPLTCGVDGQCRDECLTDRDCIVGQLCAAGTCADPEELDEAGMLPVVRAES